MSLVRAWPFAVVFAACTSFGEAASDSDAGALSDAAAAESGSNSDGSANGCNGALACERVVFVTSATFGVSEFKSPAGADARCNEAAASQGAVPRVRGRTFKAWLSDANESAGSRMPHGTGAYVRTLSSNAALAASWNDFASAKHLSAMNRDETGNVPTGDSVWSGTMTDGRPAPQDCVGWTATIASATGEVGTTTTNSGTWTFSSAAPCNGNAHLYCVEY